MGGGWGRLPAAIAFGRSLLRSLGGPPVGCFRRVVTCPLIWLGGLLGLAFSPLLEGLVYFPSGPGDGVSAKVSVAGEWPGMQMMLG